jgi:DNA-directed RNA polymerase specialized sigma subunit
MRPSKVKELERKEGRPITDILPALYEKHGSQVCVAAHIGISQARLSQILREVGLKEKTILVRSKPQ